VDPAPADAQKKLDGLHAKLAARKATAGERLEIELPEDASCNAGASLVGTAIAAGHGSLRVRVGARSIDVDGVLPPSETAFGEGAIRRPLSEHSTVDVPLVFGLKGVEVRVRPCLAPLEVAPAKAVGEPVQAITGRPPEARSLAVRCEVGASFGDVLDAYEAVRALQGKDSKLALSVVGACEGEAQVFPIRGPEKPATPWPTGALAPIAASPNFRPETLRIGAVTLVGGTTQEAALAAFEKIRPKMLECYAAGLAKDPKLGGRIALRLVVGKTGGVADVLNPNTDLTDAGVVACAVREARAFRIEPPPTGLVTLNIPFVVSPPPLSK